MLGESAKPADVECCGSLGLDRPLANIFDLSSRPGDRELEQPFIPAAASCHKSQPPAATLELTLTQCDEALLLSIPLATFQPKAISLSITAHVLALLALSMQISGWGRSSFSLFLKLAGCPVPGRGSLYT
jgi:hypothetical protein